MLLQRGAARVVALDVGHGQLDWKIRSDPRVVVLERINARTLTPGDLPPALAAFDIVTIDVSFISLRHILPDVPPCCAPAADVIVLVKPQFEAGRDEVGKGGIVRDAAVQARVVEEIAAAADALGLGRVGMTESPIAGMEGNREFLLHLRQLRVGLRSCRVLDARLESFVTTPSRDLTDDLAYHARDSPTTRDHLRHRRPETGDLRPETLETRDLRPETSRQPCRSHA